jgi:hypothetical protein
VGILKLSVKKQCLGIYNNIIFCDMSGSGRQAGANTPSGAQGRGAPQGQRGFVREVESKVRRPFENDGEWGFDL